MHIIPDVKDRNYYLNILNVGDQASQIEIKRAYHRLALKHHPDLNANDPFAADRFQLLTEAYQYLLTHPATGKRLVPRPAPGPVVSPKPAAPAAIHIEIYKRPYLAGIALGLTILFAAFILFKNTPHSTNITNSNDSDLTKLDSGIKLRPPELRKPASTRNDLMAKISRRGALGNVLGLDSKTGRCPSRTYPASFEKKDRYLSQICLKRFLHTDTVVEDIKLADPTDLCEKGYSQNATIGRANESPQTICVKIAFPEAAHRAVVRIYESDERKGCNPDDEMIGVREGGSHKPGRRRVFCQVLAQL